MLNVPQIATKVRLVRKERVKLRSCVMSRSHRGFIIFILLMLSVMSFNVIIDEIHKKQMVAVGGRMGGGWRV